MPPKNAKKYIFMLRKAVMKAWGPKPLFLKWIYTAIARPRFCYGTVVWGHTLRLPSRWENTEKLNKLAAAMITPVRRSTPLKGLEIIYDLVPLPLFCYYKSWASLIRNKDTMTLDWEGQCKKRITYIGHRKFWFNHDSTLVEFS